MKPTIQHKTISVRLNKDLYDKLIEYKNKNKINLSLFLRQIIGDRLEYLRRKSKWKLFLVDL